LTWADPYTQPNKRFSPPNSCQAGNDHGRSTLPRHRECLQDRLGEPDHLEGVVRAPTARERLDLGDRISLRRVDQVGCAELLRRLALQLDRVNRDDAGCAGDAGALDDRRTDAAAAHDRDRRAGLHAGGVE
jgi:hypothetical protein